MQQCRHLEFATVVLQSKPNRIISHMGSAAEQFPALHCSASEATICLQIWKRTSIVTTLWNYVYDHLLCDILHPGEAFIDFIAVSEKARYDAAK